MTTASEIANCRVCGSGSLRVVFDLGNLAVSDFVDGSDILRAPLTLAVCDVSRGGCSFVQLRHKAVDRHTLYRRYWYRSGVNESMRDALAAVTRDAQARVRLDPGDIVVDVGANDGTLLRAYSRDDVTRVGFEPARNLLAEARIGTDLIIPEFFSARDFKRHFDDKRAKIVTSIAMFYDLEEPHDFVQDIAEILAPDGVWVVQMAYLVSMYETNGFDNINHEHVGYYSLEVMDRLVRSHGLVIRHAELNTVNGGSIRLYIGHPAGADDPQEPAANHESVRSMLRAETELRLGLAETYRPFADRIARLREDIRSFVLDELEDGKAFHIYGASTKGNTILQYLGLDKRHFQMAADRSPQKWGLRTVATDIPIVSEETSRAARPDYLFVLPWHFRDAFVARESDFLRAGGRMLFPLPEPLVVGMADERLTELPLTSRRPPATRPTTVS